MSGVLKDGLEVGGGGGGGGYTYRAKKTKGREKRENDGTIVGNARGSDIWERETECGWADDGLRKSGIGGKKSRIQIGKISVNDRDCYLNDQAGIGS